MDNDNFLPFPSFTYLSGESIIHSFRTSLLCCEKGYETRRREREREIGRSSKEWNGCETKGKGVEEGIGTRLFGSGRDPGGAGLSISGTVTSVKRGSFPWKAEVTMTERRRRGNAVSSRCRLFFDFLFLPSLDELNERKADRSSTRIPREIVFNSLRSNLIKTNMNINSRVSIFLRMSFKSKIDQTGFFFLSSITLEYFRIVLLSKSPLYFHEK